MADPVAPTPTVDPVVPTPPVAPVTPPAAEVAKPVVEAPKTLINNVEEKKPDEVKTEEKKTEEAKAPEPFNLKEIKLPEGFNAEDPQFAKFGEIVGNDKLSPKERAEALLNMYAEGTKAVSEANTKLWTDVQKQWQEEVKGDSEIGGDKLATTTQTISKAIDTLGPELAKGFRQALDFTGAGNNPAVIRGMAKFAALLTEGGHVSGGPGSGKQSIGSVFFPNSPEFNEPQKG